MTVYRSKTDSAIIKALRGSREPLRYNELHRKASSVLGSRIWIKTFNDHLRRLCRDGEVVRNEKNRYNVTYEPARKYRDEERKHVQLEKQLLDVLLEFATEPPRKSHLRAKKLQFQKRVIKSFVKHLARRRSIVTKILSATLALTEGKEREAEMMLDDYFFDYRLILNHFIRSLSKVEGIKQITNEMTEEWDQEYKKSRQKLEGSLQEAKVFTEMLEAGKEVSEPVRVRAERLVLNLVDAFEETF